MRLNLPVTQREYPFPTGQTLVSTTDTKGRLLYCNPAFITVSGYTKDELLGQPHNLIRHPDMPEEAFRDMWATISSGRPWSAPVKNRRKDGDHYWVMANATPLMENGVPVGYMSVRTEATREQIDAAEALYAQMRDEAQAGRQVSTLSAGRVVRRTWGGRVAEWTRWGLTGRLLGTMAFTMGVATVAAEALSHGTDGAAWAAAVGWALQALGVLVAGALVSRSLVAPVERLVQSANRLAAGDLTQNLQRSRNDQLGDLETALSQLSVNLQSIVRDARDQSSEMVTGTAEIAQGNLDLSQRTEAQASSLEETASSMEEMTSAVRNASDSANQARELSTSVLLMAERSNEAVHTVSDTMKAIQESSSRINEITQVIDSIAFQTNILALNAAVEAARAGEQGRGFGVVAGEVRTLAQRTSVAAKEIKQLIEDSAHKVDSGHAETQRAREAMQKAVNGVRQVNQLVDAISTTAHEQLSGISQINAAIAQLDTITQQNAALVEQIASSAQSLEGLARSTTESVQVFRVDQRGVSLGDAVSLRKQARAATADRAALQAQRSGAPDIVVF